MNRADGTGSGTVVLSVDAGGTYYKTALVDSVSGAILPNTFCQIPSESDAGKTAVLGRFSEMLEMMAFEASKRNLSIVRVSLDFPGPFDYLGCRCMMRHKFRSIHGIPLDSIVRDVVGCDSVSFHYDLHACTYGAWLYDRAQGYSRVFCIGIGTGLGTGYLENGRIVSIDHGQPSHPIFRMPSDDGILEDIVSNRGIVRAYGHHVDDAKAVEEAATKCGDKDAYAVYRKMGTILGLAIVDLLESLSVDCIVFGGQISRGYPLFGPLFEQAVASVSSIRTIAPIRDLSTISVRGCAMLPKEV